MNKYNKMLHKYIWNDYEQSQQFRRYSFSLGKFEWDFRIALYIKQSLKSGGDGNEELSALGVKYWVTQSCGIEYSNKIQSKKHSDS